MTDKPRTTRQPRDSATSAHTAPTDATPETPATALIDLYRAIEESSAHMLAAAQAQDWEDVVRCEESCTVLIAQLRYQASKETLDENMRQEKARIMQRILHNDAQIRSLAEPWIADCERKMRSGTDSEDSSVDLAATLAVRQWLH